MKSIAPVVGDVIVGVVIGDTSRDPIKLFIFEELQVSTSDIVASFMIPSGSVETAATASSLAALASCAFVVAVDAAVTAVSLDVFTSTRRSLACVAKVFIWGAVLFLSSFHTPIALLSNTSGVSSIAGGVTLNETTCVISAMFFPYLV
jgi:hypothetical protein